LGWETGLVSWRRNLPDDSSADPLDVRRGGALHSDLEDVRRSNRSNVRRRAIAKPDLRARCRRCSGLYGDARPYDLARKANCARGGHRNAMQNTVAAIDQTRPPVEATPVAR
jgi:hypothetical protein